MKMNAIISSGKKLFPLTLLFIFLLPYLVKTYHILTVHHEHHHLIKSDIPVIDYQQKGCPICEYEFVKVIEGEEQVFNETFKIPTVYQLPYIEAIVVEFQNYFFNLRAPPSQ